MKNKKYEYVYKDKEGRIIAWLVGMSAEDQARFQKKYPDSYLSRVNVE